MVFVLNKNKKPTNMCTEAQARILLSKGAAVVHKRYPFTIRLKTLSVESVTPCHIKIDPGSKTTGFAIVDDQSHVLFLAELTHRGDQIGRASCRERV